jgi:hydrogenase maturation factor HypF (carbamoyltransferase family)
MKIAETCSCGASMKVEGDDSLKIIRDWRKNHVCQHRDDDDVSIIISDNAQIERSIGFQPQGLEMPVVPGDPDEDE